MEIMKFNPGFLTDDQLVASFCVRVHEFNSTVEMLRECKGNSNPHRLVIGPRGCGKTTLLLRIAVEIRRDPKLSQMFVPIVFAEESYGVSTSDEFWLEALSCLANQAPLESDDDNLRLTLKELNESRGDRTFGKRCLGTLLDYADQRGKRLVLIVENLDMMFRDMADSNAGWNLRQTLQTEPRVILLAGATSRFEEIDQPDRAFYDLFVTHAMRPLGIDECAVLWENVTGKHRSPDAMRGLKILTGGSPRLLSVMARFGAEMSFRDLMADLLRLIDDLTAYFKNYIEALPPQERRVFLALADIWEPASARDISRITRLDTTKCSAQLRRLIDRGVVEVVGGEPRRKLYYLSERLYNIYYLLRRSRTPSPLVKALIRFMEAYYSPPELKTLGSRMVREVKGLESEASVVAKALNNRAGALNASDRLVEAVEACDDIARRFGDNIDRDVRLQAIYALLNKSGVLHSLKQLEESIEVCDEIVRKFGGSDDDEIDAVVGRSLARKVGLLEELSRFEEALAVCEEIARRFEDTSYPENLETFAMALIHKASLFIQLNRLEESIVACDEVFWRMNDGATVRQQSFVARAAVLKGTALDGLGREQEAVAAWTDVVDSLGNCEDSEVREPVVIAMLQLAESSRRSGDWKRAEETVYSVFEKLEKNDSGFRCDAYLILTQTQLACGDEMQAEKFAKEALLQLPDHSELLGKCIDVLVEYAIVQSLASVGKMIKESPSAEVLFPLSVALDRELGRAPQVAREVEEVAEDIRRDLDKRRRGINKGDARSAGTGEV